MSDLLQQWCEDNLCDRCLALAPDCGLDDLCPKCLAKFKGECDSLDEDL